MASPGTAAGRRASAASCACCVSSVAARRIASRCGSAAGIEIATQHGMATQQPPDDAPDVPPLEDEHRMLKRQTEALRLEHERMEAEGASRAAHQQHIEKLRAKLRELERHAERLQNARKPPG